MEWFVTFASIPKCESLACDHCTSPPWLPQQHRWEAGLQNHCLHYTARWKLCHLHWSIDRNCKVCEQFRAGRKGSILLLLDLPVSLQLRVSWHQRQQTDVRVHVCVISKCPSRHSLSPRKGYCTILSRSMRPWVIICLVCVSHASLACPELLIFHLRMWAFPAAMDVQLCCWRGSCPGTSPIQVLSAWTFSPRAQMTAPDFK